MAKRTNDLPKKAFTFKVYPHKDHTTFFAQSFGCARFVYNKGLAHINGVWEKTKAFPKQEDVIKLLPVWKKEDPFLREVDAIILQSSIEHLFRGLDRFRGRKSRQLKKGFLIRFKLDPTIKPKIWDYKGYPRFKSKKKGIYSFTTKMTNHNCKVIESDGKQYVKLPKHKELIRFKQTRKIEGKIKTVQIKTDNVGNIYVVFTCEFNYCPYIGKAANDIIGIDVGLTSLITDSNGHQVPVPVRYSHYQKRLTFLQRKLSRQQMGSASWERTRKQIAKKHKDVYNLRTDALHKISTQLVRDNQTIVMEGLHVQQMLQEKKYANGIAHASWSKLKELMKQKCHMYGRTLIEVDQFFPSTQMCSVCHVINPALKGNTTIRTWTCQECRSTHERDHNAAINLYHEGKRMMTI